MSCSFLQLAAGWPALPCARCRWVMQPVRTPRRCYAGLDLPGARSPGWWWRWARSRESLTVTRATWRAWRPALSTSCNLPSRRSGRQSTVAMYRPSKSLQLSLAHNVVIQLFAQWTTAMSNIFTRQISITGFRYNYLNFQFYLRYNIIVIFALRYELGL